MSYRPPQGPDPYDANDPHMRRDDYYEPRRRERRPSEGRETAARIVRMVVALVVLIFALHVLFVVLDANQGNGFVALIYTLAQTFVLGLGDVFTPDDALLGVVLNYGLAALIWFIVGQFVIKLLRRE
ncbi:hypothetical protein [Saccharopolyspora griseoalba]|uniref:Potassium channel domain-containing protein n=1 Tax=Saccharopolyspora griseoalba TaxID=1431848 RepID=A0ABW2LMN9_9PSEU